MKPSALPRCSAGHVSDTSAAPLAHSPPMPMPSRMRKTRQLRRSVGEAAGGGEDRVDDDARHQRARAAVAIGDDAEDEAAARPRRRASPSRCAPAGLARQPRSAMIDGSTSAYSMTSNASSIQPSAGGDERALRVGRCRRATSRTGRRGRASRRRRHWQSSRRTQRTATPLRSRPARSCRASTSRPACRRACRSCRHRQPSSEPSTAVTPPVGHQPHRTRARPPRGRG